MLVYQNCLSRNFKVQFAPVAGMAHGALQTGVIPFGQTNMRHPQKVGNQILIVDDEPSVRQWVAAILRRSGYRALEAESGAEALSILSGASGQVAIMLTDVRMPGMDGSELAQRVSDNYEHIRVLYMTGYAADALAPKAPVLHKPFTRAALLTEIERALGESTDLD